VEQTIRLPDAQGSDVSDFLTVSRLVQTRRIGRVFGVFFRNLQLAGRLMTRRRQSDQTTCDYSWQAVEIRRMSAACYWNMDVTAKSMTVKSLIL
jgi:hypothetical protein